MNSNISDKDKKDWENFLSSKEKLIDKDIKEKTKFSAKDRSIDLHGYSLEKANQVVEEFIKKAFEENVAKLTVVTGKGLHSEYEKNPYVSEKFGILKNSVPEFILKNKNLMKLIINIDQAKIEDGGEGAFYIFLKKK